MKMTWAVFQVAMNMIQIKNKYKIWAKIPRPDHPFPCGNNRTYMEDFSFQKVN